MRKRRYTPKKRGTDKYLKAQQGIQFPEMQQVPTGTAIAGGTAQGALKGAQIGSAIPGGAVPGAIIGGAFELGRGLLERGDRLRENQAIADAKNLYDDQHLTGHDSKLMRQMNIARNGMDVDERGMIEIEGMGGVGELHYDKNWNLKNVGTRPHEVGGDKVEAMMGDKVIPVQGDLEEQVRVMKLVNRYKKGDKLAKRQLDMIENSLPDEREVEANQDNAGAKQMFQQETGALLKYQEGGVVGPPDGPRFTGSSSLPPLEFQENVVDPFEGPTRPNENLGGTVDMDAPAWVVDEEGTPQRPILHPETGEQISTGEWRDLVKSYNNGDTRIPYEWTLELPQGMTTAVNNEGAPLTIFGRDIQEQNLHLPEDQQIKTQPDGEPIVNVGRNGEVSMPTKGAPKDTGSFPPQKMEVLPGSKGEKYSMTHNKLETYKEPVGVELKMKMELVEEVLADPNASDAEKEQAATEKGELEQVATQGDTDGDGKRTGGDLLRYGNAIGDFAESLEEPERYDPVSLRLDREKFYDFKDPRLAQLGQQEAVDRANLQRQVGSRGQQVGAAANLSSRYGQAQQDIFQDEIARHAGVESRNTQLANQEAQFAAQQQVYGREYDAKARAAQRNLARTSRAETQDVYDVLQQEGYMQARDAKLDARDDLLLNLLLKDTTQTHTFEKDEQGRLTGALKLNETAPQPR
jgi:hypothetical protein